MLSLNLSNNHLTVIPLFKLRSLKQIEIHNNPLKFPPYRFVQFEEWNEFIEVFNDLSE
jgi:Leucine-rich repeat (LRR) protein